METICIAASAIAGMLGIGSLLRKGRTHPAILFALLMIDLSTMLGLSAFRYARLSDGLPEPARLLSPFALSGVLVYLFFMSLARPGEERVPRRAAPFLLLAPALVSDAIALLSDRGALIVKILHPATVSISLALYVGSIIHVFKLYTPRTMTKSAWMILSVSAVATLAILSGLLGSLAGGDGYFRGMDSLASLAAIAAAALDYRFPGGLERFNEETVRRRYARSLLAGLDVDGLADGMVEMMKRTALYRESGLDLDTLADRMGLSAHQVSELLNDRMGTSFSAFVNGFRIDEARELLASRPEASILDIALDVGFGNKTSFNEAFKRRVRMTPSQFRRQPGN